MIEIGANPLFARCEESFPQYFGKQEHEEYNPASLGENPNYYLDFSESNFVSDNEFSHDAQNLWLGIQTGRWNTGEIKNIWEAKGTQKSLKDSGPLNDASPSFTAQNSVETGILSKSVDEVMFLDEIRISAPSENLKKSRGPSQNTADYSGRRDVVYKNLVRNTRKYLWELFCKSQTKETMKKLNKKCRKFETYVDGLYMDNFQKNVQKIFSPGSDDEKLFKEVLAVFMTHKHSTSNKSVAAKRVTELVNKTMRIYWSREYFRLFNSPGVPAFFKILKETGIFDQMILSNPNLNSNKDRYLDAVDSVINFEVNPNLMK